MLHTKFVWKVGCDELATTLILLLLTLSLLTLRPERESCLASLSIAFFTAGTVMALTKGSMAGDIIPGLTKIGKLANTLEAGDGT